MHVHGYIQIEKKHAESNLACKRVNDPPQKLKAKPAFKSKKSYQNHFSHFKPKACKEQDMVEGI